MTRGSWRTTSGSPVAIRPAKVECGQGVDVSENQVEVVVDDHDGDALILRERRTISPSAAVSRAFMPAAGSSSRRSFGRPHSARAISTRRCTPYDSVVGLEARTSSSTPVGCERLVGAP